VHQFEARGVPLVEFLHPLSHAHPNRELCAKSDAIVIWNIFPTALLSRKEEGMMGGKADNHLPPKTSDHLPK
jgi:hypothetical protein